MCSLLICIYRCWSLEVFDEEVHGGKNCAGMISMLYKVMLNVVGKFVKNQIIITFAVTRRHSPREDTQRD